MGGDFGRFAVATTGKRRDRDRRSVECATAKTTSDRSSATNYFRKDDSVPMRSPAASYSMVLLQRVVAGKVETQLIEGEFYPKAYPKAVQEEGRFDAPNAYKVIAVLDLDGDGKMEVVIHSDYCEGGETTIYRCDPKKAEALLSVACGT